MPNHCANRLAISGPLDIQAEFRRFAKGSGPAWDKDVPGKWKDHACVSTDTEVCLICKVNPPEEEDLDLNKFVPVPEEFLIGRGGRDAFNSGGYQWVCEHWGTKWGCYDTVVTQEKNRTLYEFKTAWSPFNEATHIAMSKKFPKLKLELKFAERGTEYYGTRVARAGKITSSSFNNKKGGRPGGKVMQKLWGRSG